MKRPHPSQGKTTPRTLFLRGDLIGVQVLLEEVVYRFGSRRAVCHAAGHFDQEVSVVVLQHNPIHIVRTNELFRFFPPDVQRGQALRVNVRFPGKLRTLLSPRPPAL